jgi:uncharacterized protein HemX
MATGLLASSGLLTSWLVFKSSPLEAQEAAPPTAAAESSGAEVVQITPNRSGTNQGSIDQATTLLSIMLGALVLLLGVGIAMLWALRRSVVNEVATIVRTQLNEMTELENKVHNATRSLNRILADADDLSASCRDAPTAFNGKLSLSEKFCIS